MRVLIDGNNFCYRACPKLKSDPLITTEGQNVTVLHAVIYMLQNFIRSQDEIEEITFCWDIGDPTSKEEILPEYKKQRETTELTVQIATQSAILRQHLQHFGIKQVGIDGIEADDIVGIIAPGLARIGKEVLIVTADKDYLQLVNDKISVYNPLKGKTITESNFEEVVGLPKDSFVDYLSMLGDKVDNIKGIDGIGDVYAKKILEKYGTYANAIHNETDLRSLAVLEGPHKTWAKKAICILSQSNRDLMERNHKLIKLGNLLSAQQRVQILTMYACQKPTFNAQEVMNFFHQYQLGEFISRFQDVALCFSSLSYVNF